MNVVVLEVILAAWGWAGVSEVPSRRRTGRCWPRLNEGGFSLGWNCNPEEIEGATGVMGLFLRRSIAVVSFRQQWSQLTYITAIFFLISQELTVSSPIRGHIE